MDQSTRSFQTRLFTTYAPVKAPEVLPTKQHRIDELALRASGLGVWVLDLVTREFHTSDRFREVLTHAPAESSANEDWSDLFQLVHEEDREMLFENMEGQLDGMWPLDVELRLQIGARTSRWYRLAGNSLQNADGTPLLISGTIEDVTERRRADEDIRKSAEHLRQLATEMRQSEERFRQLTEHMEDMFWLEDTSTREAIYVNPALSKVLSVSQEVFLKDPTACWRAVALPEDAEMAGQLATEDPNQKTEVTFRIALPDNSIRWIHARTFPIFDENGVAYRAAGIAQNITEFKTAQDRQRESQKLESIGQLAAGVAHEINTPIQYVSDNLHFLKESFESLRKVTSLAREIAERGAEAGSLAADLAVLRELVAAEDIDFVVEELPKAVGQALDGTNQVTRIVRAMKEFSHPGDPDHASPVDINKTIESATMVSRNEWKYVADLELNLCRDLPNIPSFPGSLGQVIINIVVNASHAIADVVGESGEKGRITISTALVGDQVEISIQDTGAGIPEAIRHRVFDPFFTSKQVGKGTGQGLCLAWVTIVDRHHGSIRLESKVGEGTTFFLRLPVNGPEEQEQRLSA